MGARRFRLRTIPPRGAKSCGHEIEIHDGKPTIAVLTLGEGASSFDGLEPAKQIAETQKDVASVIVLPHGWKLEKYAIEET